jgi:hypothetical protein
MPSRRHRPQILGDVRAADELQHHVGPGAAGGVEVGRREGRPAGQQAHVEPELARPLQLVRRARRPADEAPERARDLHARRTDAAARRVDQHPLPRLKPRLHHHRVVRREERLGDRRGLLGREPRRDRRDLALVHHDLLGVGAARDETIDPIARRVAARARAHRVDHARVLEAGDVRRHARRRRVEAGPLHQIGAVHARVLHADPHLPVPGFGDRDVAKSENFRPARLTNDDGSHDDSPTPAALRPHFSRRAPLSWSSPRQWCHQTMTRNVAPSQVPRQGF